MPHHTYESRSSLNGPKNSTGLHVSHAVLKDEVSRRQRKIYTIFSLGISLSLSGCMGIYEEGFECPPGKGVGCKSISEVNHMVNEGVLGSRVVKEIPSMGHPPQGPYDQSPSSVSSDCDSCTSRHTVQGLSRHASSGEPQIWYAPFEGEPIQWKPPQGSISKVDSSRTLSDQLELSKTESSKRVPTQWGGEA